jgi:hypothetical protein
MLLLVFHEHITAMHGIRTKIACFTVSKGLPIRAHGNRIGLQNVAF